MLLHMHSGQILASYPIFFFSPINISKEWQHLNVSHIWTLRGHFCLQACTLPWLETVWVPWFQAAVVCNMGVATRAASLNSCLDLWKLIQTLCIKEMHCMDRTPSLILIYSRLNAFILLKNNQYNGFAPSSHTPFEWNRWMLKNAAAMR